MPPDKAARMIEKMDDRTVTEVFQTMRSKEVGGILTHLDPARAARISANLSLLSSQNKLRKNNSTPSCLPWKYLPLRPVLNEQPPRQFL